MQLKCHYCGTSRGQVPPCECSRVTEASVKAELAEHHVIYIPLKQSPSRTPLMTAKREVLMKLVYTGQIQIDLFTPSLEDGSGEICTVFLGSKPKI